MRKALIGILFFIPFITNAFGVNVFTGPSGGNVSCDSQGLQPCVNANDQNLATAWGSDNTSFPHWWKYQLSTSSYPNGANITKITLSSQSYCGVNGCIKDFTLDGSNNGTTWATILSGVQPNNTDNVDYTNTTTTCYAYYRVNITSNYRADSYGGFGEIQGFEPTSYSCSVATSSATSTIGFMSPQLDFMLQLLVEAVFVCLGIFAGYLVVKKFTKK